MAFISTRVHVSEDVDVDIDIDELDDDDILECVAEAKKRGLVGGNSKSRRDRLAFVYEDLVAGRTRGALANFEAAIFDDDETGLFDAWQALRDGKWSAAICRLDSAVYARAPLTKKTMITPTDMRGTRTT